MKILNLLVFLLGFKFVTVVGKIGLFGTPMPKFIFPSKVANTTNKRISVPVMLHYGGIYGAGTLLTESMQIALDAVTDSGILGDTELHLELFDSQCAWHLAAKKFLEEVVTTTKNSTTRIPLIIGPSCGDGEVIGSLAQHFNFTGITAVSNEAKMFENRGLYKNFNIMMPSQVGFYIALPYFLQANGWRRVFYISDGRDYVREHDETIMATCQTLNITIAASYKLPYDAGSFQVPMDHIHDTILELKKRDARVIIFKSMSIIDISCALYHHGMYGPGYTFIYSGIMAFRPDTPMKYFVQGLNCTDEHLFEILKSTIFYGISTMANVHYDRPDSYGISAREFDRRMKERIIEPEKSFIWWYYRTAFYDLVTSAGIVLGTLINGNKEITDETLQATIEKMNFKGLFSDISNGSWNLKLGPAAFYQVQIVDLISNKTKLSLSDQLVNAPVAQFEPLGNRLILGPKPQKWRTSDGSPPRDTLKVVRKKLPSVLTSWSASLLTFSIVDLIAIFVCLFFHRDVESKVVLLLGMSILMVAVIIFMTSSLVNISNLNTSCMVGSVFNVLGISLITTSFVIILQEIMASATDLKVQHTAWVSRNRTRTLTASKRTQVVERPRQASKTLRRLTMVLIPLLTTSISIVWFIVEPLGNVQINGPLLKDAIEISVRHQSYYLKCEPGAKSIYFIAVILVALAVTALLASFFNLSIRSSQNGRYGNMAKLSWNMTLIATVAGGIVTISFFPENIVEACSLMDIIICSIVISSLFTVKSEQRSNR